MKSAGIDDHGDQPRGANQTPHEIKNTAHLVPDPNPAKDSGEQGLRHWMMPSWT